MFLCKYFVFFIFYSFLGWIYESCYCTIHEHSWQNRGFLYGPCVPIYGVGATVTQILFTDLPIEKFHNASNLTIFLVCAIGSFFLEYTTSYILEKRFHARWWDYSNLPLNINGRVCLLFTACFGIAGVIISNFIIPPIAGLGDVVPPIIFELLSLLLMLLLGMDLALTISSLTAFSREFDRINEAINTQIAEKYTLLETNVVEKKNAGIEKLEEGKEVLIEKRDQTAEKLNELKEIPAEKLAELKEQLSKEYVSKVLSNASWPQLSQLKHIQRFTHPVASTKALMERGAGIIKSKKDSSSDNQPKPLDE